MNNIFDFYEYKARLFPVLLTILVPVISIILIAPWLLPQQMQPLSLAVLLVILVALVPLEILVRKRGKIIEKELFADWGGAPTSLILLISKSQLNPLLLNKYRSFLESKIHDLKFPSEAEEIEQPKKSVEICDFAIKWLLEATRDKKTFPLILRENANYGYLRNFLGIKRLTLLVYFFTLIVTIWHGLSLEKYDLSIVTFLAFSAIVTPIFGIILLSIVVTKNNVKEAAFDYAKTLLAACNSPYLQAITTSSQL